MKVDFILPKFKLLSGAERFVLCLGQALAKRGHRVRILCHRIDPTCRPLAKGLPVVETGVRLEWTGNHYLDSISSYLLSFRLWRHVAADTKVVCLFGPALPLAARPRRGAPKILYFCYEPPRAIGVDSSDVLARVGALRWGLAPALRAYRNFDRWLVRRVDRVLVSGEFARQLIHEEYGLDSHVITPGISVTDASIDRAGARKMHGIEPTVPVALTVNFLHPRKRVDLLLRAWKRVTTRLPEAKLLVVGDGPEGPALRSLSRALRLDGVTFSGFVPEEDLAACYRAADVLVHTARLETFGLTIVEAGRCGLPVVVVDEGGPRYTVRDGETGMRVTAEEGAVAEALLGLLEHPERAREMGERARKHVRSHYTWERGAREFEAACAAIDVDG